MFPGGKGGKKGGPKGGGKGKGGSPDWGCPPEYGSPVDALFALMADKEYRAQEDCAWQETRAWIDAEKNLEINIIKE